jgi:tetratricopeptide (TPR) repeat protein
MNKSAIILSGACLLLWLGGCAAPSPYGGAPVVDRSVYRQPQQPAAPAAPTPAPTVQVTPLEPTEPLTPQTIDQPEQAAIQPSEPEPQVAPEAPQPAPAPEPQGNQAVVTLLDSAANHVVNNELDQAAASLERALRIEPRNATIWHDLGQVRLHQRSYDQAEAMFEKSNSLASDKALQARNWRMIAAARRASGDAGGADAAEAQAVTLER